MHSTPATGAAAMSGTPHDDSNRHLNHAPSRGIDTEFEADLQCALANRSPVLITAPPDLASAVASRIHQSGHDRRGAFLTVDCSRTVRPEQIDIAFEAAGPRGTVYLRDVDRLPRPIQDQLYVRIMPLGVRVIAGTSVSLLCASAAGEFDERLFYRLNQIHLVPARPGGVVGSA
jgi:transcriptional regulator of acetoin/glycerol metabolism